MVALRTTRELQFITTTVIDWLDVFTRPTYKRIIVDSLRYCQENKGLQLYAWVLMTNHMHLIGSSADDRTMGDILRDFKKFTSKKIISAIFDNQQESRRDLLLDRCWFRGVNDRKIKEFKLWQDGYYSESICSYNFYRQKLDYIHMNPVRQEIVQRPEDYMYSSAKNYCGCMGLLNVIVQP